MQRSDSSDPLALQGASALATLCGPAVSKQLEKAATPINQAVDLAAVDVHLAVKDKVTGASAGQEPEEQEDDTFSEQPVSLGKRTQRKKSFIPTWEEPTAQPVWSELVAVRKRKRAVPVACELFHGKDRTACWPLEKGFAGPDAEYGAAPTYIVNGAAALQRNGQHPTDFGGPLPKKLGPAKCATCQKDRILPIQKYLVGTAPTKQRWIAVKRNLNCKKCEEKIRAAGGYDDAADGEKVAAAGQQAESEDE